MRATATPGWRVWALVAVAVAAVVAYLWPAIAREPDRVEVVLAGDGQLAESGFELGRRIRERGASVDDRLLGTTADPCTAVDHVAAVDAPVVVLSFRSTACLPDLVDAARPAHVLVVLQPGPGGHDDPAASAVRALDGEEAVTVVDPSRLLPPDGRERVPCEWWDDCEPDGLVRIRPVSGGSLTTAGRERLARAVAGAIP